MLGMLTSEIMNGHMDALAIGRKCAKCERHNRKPRSWIFEQAGLLMEEVCNERLSWP